MLSARKTVGERKTKNGLIGLNVTDTTTRKTLKDNNNNMSANTTPSTNH